MNNNTKYTCDIWTKYQTKIYDFVLNELIGLCLVEKNNVSRTYHGSNNTRLFMQFRFKGHYSRRICQIIYSENNSVIFDKTEKTPELLYLEFYEFINKYKLKNPENLLFNI